MKNETLEIEPLHQTEASRLAELEIIIKEGIATFRTTGAALAEISESKLYRADYGTFEEYCAKKWEIGRARAYQLIDAAAVVEALPANLSNMVDNDRQVRELAKVKPAKRENVLRKVKKEAGRGKPITAKLIREVSKPSELRISRIPPPSRRPRTASQNQPRGGLAADARAEQAEEKAEAKSDNAVLAKMDKWWSNNATRLSSYPAATPKVVFKEIRKIVEDALK